jgi:hypothetical protein
MVFQTCRKMARSLIPMDWDQPERNLVADPQIRGAEIRSPLVQSTAEAIPRSMSLRHPHVSRNRNNGLQVGTNTLYS